MWWPGATTERPKGVRYLFAILHYEHNSRVQRRALSVIGTLPFSSLSVVPATFKERFWRQRKALEHLDRLVTEEGRG